METIDIFDADVGDKLMQFHVSINDPDTFVVGNVVGVFDDFILVQKVSPRGEWDGFALYLKADLVAVSRDEGYLGMLEKLLRLKHQIPAPAPRRLSGGLKTILTYGEENKRIVALEVYKSGNQDAVGYIIRQSKTYTCLRQVDPFGKMDGVSYIANDAITRVFVGDADLICLEMLFSCR